MKKIGLFYGEETLKTAQIAKKLIELLGQENVETVYVESAKGSDVNRFDHIIAGTSTWFDGELPTYWDEFRPELESLDLKGKKVALFGLGDQNRYPENFMDGVGILAEVFEASGAKIVGLTSPQGYEFQQSRALKNGKLFGLAIDFENQQSKTNERLKNWTEQLRKEFV